MSITKTPNTTTVPLYQGEDLARIRDLSAVLQKAMTEKVRATGDVPRAGDGDPMADAARAYDDFVQEALPRAAQVKLQAVPRRAYRTMCAAHPPRPDVTGPAVTGEDGSMVPGEVVETYPSDARYGFDVDAMSDDLVPASIAPGQFGSVEERDTFLDGLSDGEWSKLFWEAVPLNQDGGPDPKAPVSSMLGRIFGETSTSPNDSD